MISIVIVATRSMSPIYRIEDLTLDFGRQRVARNGEKIPLGPLTYKLLLLLAEKAPNLATHDDIADAVWSGRAVSPETVKQRLKLLRDALGDDAEHPRYIEVARGRGYRLIPRVIEQDAVALGTRSPKKRIAAYAALALLILTILAAWIRWPPPDAVIDRPSVAVLAFVDMSPEQDEDYFAQGLSEEILNLLSTSTSLTVIARTSSFAFRGRDADVETIGKTLHVSHVLEGSVRKYGDRVRINVQLIDASDSTEVWSETFEEEIGDILALEARVATSVADSLRANLLGEQAPAAAAAQRVNPQAFDWYLRGQQQLRAYTAESLANAEEHFQRAIELDPDFIPSYYQLGFVYVMQVVDVQVPIPKNRAKLRSVVERGLVLAPDNGALIGLSGQLARYDGDNDLAERQLRRAMEIDSSNMLVRSLYAMFVADQGYPDKCLEITRRSREIDPLNPLLFIGTPFLYIDLWDAREAMAAASHIERFPGASALPLYAVTKLLLLGDLSGSVRDSRAFMRGIARATEPAYGHPMLYFDLGDLDSGDAAMQLWRRFDPDTASLDATGVQQMVAHGELQAARARAVELLEKNQGYTGHWNNVVVARIATDALIDSGRAQRAVDLIETLAPVYADYKRRPDIHVREFSPPPFAVKSNYSSFPAIFFPDYIHALKASGDEAGADNMLGHLEAILQDRRQRELYLEERFTAEALALGGKNEAALDALEQAERDRTIYRNWEIFLVHSSIFSEIREQPRYSALLDRIRREMARQLAALADDAAANGTS